MTIQPFCYTDARAFNEAYARAQDRKAIALRSHAPMPENPTPAEQICIGEIARLYADGPPEIADRICRAFLHRHEDPRVIRRRAHGLLQMVARRRTARSG